MTRTRTWLLASLLAALLAGMCFTPTSRAADIGYVEDFALAKDRAAALKQLISGTEDYYYYHALHALNSGNFAAVDGIFKLWVERHGYTARMYKSSLAARC